MVDTGKDTGETRMILVPYRKGARLKRRLWVLFFILLFSAAGMGGGYHFGLQERTNAVSERDELVIEKAGLDKQIIQLQDQVAIYKHGSELEKQATERVRQENVQLQNRVSEL